MNLGLRFYKVDGLTVKNIELHESHWWGMKIEDATNVTVRDYHPTQTESTNNQDGIDLVGPVSNATLERIHGSSGDDMLGLLAGSNWDNVEGPVAILRTSPSAT